MLQKRLKQDIPLLTQQGDASCMVHCHIATHGSLFGIIGKWGIMHNDPYQTYTYSIAISKPNRDPSVAIWQWTMHGASPCCVRRRMSCFQSFCSDLYFNAVILVQIAFNLVWIHFVTHARNCVAAVVVLGFMYHAGDFHKVVESIRWNNCWNIGRRCAMKWPGYSNQWHNVRKEITVKIL